MSAVTPNDESNSTCAICLNEIDLTSQSIVKMPCKHFVCIACGMLWMNKLTQCPLCRAPLGAVQGNPNQSKLEARDENIEKMRIRTAHEQPQQCHAQAVDYYVSRLPAITNPNMQIFVKMLTGKTLTLYVHSESDIGQLMQLIYESEAILPRQCQLIWAGKKTRTRLHICTLWHQ